MSLLTDALGLEPTSHRGAGLGPRLRSRYARWRIYRRTRDELQSLSDRDLADLGLHRTMITQIARDAAYGGA